MFRRSGATRSRGREILEEENAVIWRLGAVDRWVFPGYAFGVFATIGVYELVVGSMVPGIILLISGTGLSACLGLRPLAVMGAREIYIRNPARSHIVNIVDIVSLEQTWEGLHLQLVDGTTTNIWAIQKWNVAVFLKRRTAADDAADQIRGRQRRLGPRTAR